METESKGTGETHVNSRKDHVKNHMRKMKNRRLGLKAQLMIQSLVVILITGSVFPFFLYPQHKRS